jgi:hypothetical protein
MKDCMGEKADARKSFLRYRQRLVLHGKCLRHGNSFSKEWTKGFGWVATDLEALIEGMNVF